MLQRWVEVTVSSLWLGTHRWRQGGPGGKSAAISAEIPLPNDMCVIRQNLHAGRTSFMLFNKIPLFNPASNRTAPPRLAALRRLG